MGNKGFTMVEATISLLILAVAAAVIVLTLLYWALARLKRSLKSPLAFQRGSGWTVEQIKELHQSGQLTDIQYRSLRDAVVRGMQKPHSEEHSRR